MPRATQANLLFTPQSLLLRKGFVKAMQGRPSPLVFGIPHGQQVPVFENSCLCPMLGVHRALMRNMRALALPGNSVCNSCSRASSLMKSSSSCRTCSHACKACCPLSEKDQLSQRPAAQSLGVAQSGRLTSRSVCLRLSVPLKRNTACALRSEMYLNSRESQRSA